MGPQVAALGGCFNSILERREQYHRGESNINHGGCFNSRPEMREQYHHGESNINCQLTRLYLPELFLVDQAISIGAVCD